MAHVDRSLLECRHRHAITRAGIDFHDLVLMEFVFGRDDEATKIDPIFEIVDDDSLDLAAQRGEDIGEEIMGEGAFFFGPAEVNAECRPDRLVDVNRKDLFLIAEENRRPSIGRNERSNLYRYHGLVHGLKLAPHRAGASGLKKLQVLPQSWQGDDRYCSGEEQNIAPYGQEHFTSGGGRVLAEAPATHDVAVP